MHLFQQPTPGGEQPAETPASAVATPGGEAAPTPAAQQAAEAEAVPEEVRKATPEGFDKIEVIGNDANTKVKLLSHMLGAPPADDSPSQDPKNRPVTPNTKNAYEALSALDGLQTQLV